MDEQNSQRIPELDGVRGIAIFLVLLWHYVALTLETQPGSLAAYVVACLRLSWSGVDLFFVLSGFLIGGILIDNRNAKNYFRVFYARRTCRILPLYFAWLMVFCALLLAQGTLFSPALFSWLLTDPLPLFSYATFTQNILMAFGPDIGPSWMGNWMGVTWSLAVEEQFYLALPFIVRYSDPRKLPWLLVSMVLAAPIIRIALFVLYSDKNFSVYVLMPCRADSLLLGVLGAWTLRQRAITQLLANHAKSIVAALGILLMGAAALTVKSASIISFGMVSFGYSWLALLYLFFLLAVVTQKHGILKAVVSNYLLRRLGTISYGVYLFHQGALGLAHGLILHQAPRIQNIQDLAVTAFALAVALVGASVSWQFFEKRLVAVGHRLQYDKMPRKADAELSSNRQTTVRA